MTDVPEVPHTYDGEFVARTHVVHLVQETHEPFTVYPNGVATNAITTTVCGIQLQGLPLDGVEWDDDYYCQRCEAVMAR